MGGSQDEYQREVVSRQPARKQANTLLRKLKEFEKQLNIAVSKNSPFDKQVHIIRQNIKEVVVKIVLQDLNYAITQDVEQSLWKMAFYRVIEDSRKKLKKLSDNLTMVDNPQKLSATKEEHSQLTRLYLSFLDESTGFYHSLIDMMASRFQLDQSPGRFLNIYRPLSMKSEPHVSLEMKDMALSVCHKCLIFLGDLARYKQLASAEESKDWDVPSSYYSEAVDLIPSNGNPFNQLAVIATYQNEEMDAAYYYFRSIAVRMPFMTAEENLNLIFQKTKRTIDQDAKKADMKKKFLRIHSFLFLEENCEQFESRLIEFLEDFGRFYRDSNENHGDFIFKAMVINLSSAFFFAVHRNESPRKAELVHLSFRLLMSMAECFFSQLVSKLHSIPVETVRSSVSEWDLAAVKVLINWFCVNTSAIEAALRNEQQKKPSLDTIDTFRSLLPAIYRLGGQFIWEGHFQRQALREDFELRGFLPLDLFSRHLQFHPFILMSDEWEERIRSIASSGLDFFRSLETFLPSMQTSNLNPYLSESNASALTAGFSLDSSGNANVSDPPISKNRLRNLSGLDPHADEVITYNGKQLVIPRGSSVSTTSLRPPLGGEMNVANAMSVQSNGFLSSSYIHHDPLSLPTSSASGTMIGGANPMNCSQIWKATASPMETQEILYPFGLPTSETHLSQFATSERYSPIQSNLVSSRDLLPPPTSLPSMVQAISIGSRRSSRTNTNE